ncbi:hypothetical protein C7B65_19560 [Phormidesmis priestleyi ULC007]|uniref:CopG family transcriptional regulator n=1 Tax=Phormidesmis priestleyi ULC007 TaxID=1920490 RepID=A0A2T1D9D4_9CYAN|nr:hypothetical protein C7B65_19560 [Phormidesmis priestleyi ULC007]
MDNNENSINLRVEESRHQKLRDVAKERKKTMTQLIEDWIDRLPNPNKEISVAEAALRPEGGFPSVGD